MLFLSSTAFILIWFNISIFIFLKFILGENKNFRIITLDCGDYTYQSEFQTWYSNASNGIYVIFMHDGWEVLLIGFKDNAYGAFIYISYIGNKIDAIRINACVFTFDMY